MTTISKETVQKLGLSEDVLIKFLEQAEKVSKFDGSCPGKLHQYRTNDKYYYNSEPKAFCNNADCFLQQLTAPTILAWVNKQGQAAAEQAAKPQGGKNENWKGKPYTPAKRTTDDKVNEALAFHKIVVPLILEDAKKTEGPNGSMKLESIKYWTDVYLQVFNEKKGDNK